MRAILIAGFVTFAANAQADTITEACASIVQDAARADVIQTSSVQSFPDLTPPRVSFEFTFSEEEEPLDILARCLFSSSSKSLQLLEICLNSVCWNAGREGETLLRFEEMQALLTRRGF